MNQSEIIYNQQSLDIKYLLKLFEQGEQTQNDVLNKDMILLVGPTGSGKTTTVNYLLGHKMFLQKKMKNLEIDGEYYLSEYTVIESSGGFEIGHSKQSHTINLQLAHARDGTYLCDSPGFFDNRGSEIEITNASSLKKFMQNCKSVRLVVLIGYHELIAQRGALFQELFRLVARILTNPEKDQFEKMTFLFTKVPEKQTINSIQKEFIDILEIVGNNDEIQNQTLVEFLKVIVKQTKQNGNAIVNPLSGDNDILLNYIMQQKSFSKPSADFCFSVSEASNQKLSLYVQETNNQITKLLQQFQFSRIMDILIQFKQVKDYTEDQFLIDSFIDLQNEIVRSFEKNKNQVFNNFCEASEKSNIFSSQIIQDIIQILKQLRTIDENKGQVFKEGAFKTNENQFKNDIENICSEMSKRIKRDFPQNMESVKTNLQKLRDFTGQTQLGTQSYLQSQQELKVVFEQEKQNLLELSQNFYSNTNQQDIQNIKSNVSQIAQKLQLLKQICLFVKDFVQSENEENFYEAIVKNEQKKNEELVVYLKTQIDYLNQEIQKQPSIDDSQVQFNPKISNLPALQINILKILNQNSSYSECIPECDNNYVKAVGYFNQFFRDAFNLIKENTGDDFHLYKLKDILSTLEEMRNLDMEILGQTFEEFKQIKDEIKQKIQKKAQEAKKLISQHLDELEYINEEDSDDFDDTLSVKSITDLRKSFSQIQKKDFNKLKKIYLFLKNMNWADSYFQSNFTQNTIKKIKQKMENYLEQCSQKISNSLENEKFYLVNFFLWKMKSLSDFKEILEKYQEKNQACIDQVRKTVIEKNKPILDLINIQIQDNTYKNFPWQTINQNIQYLNKVQQLDIISDVKQNSISILNTITAKIQNYYQQNMQKMQQLEKEQG